MTGSCGECVYWDSNDGHQGMCRRRPPIRSNGHGGGWPRSKADDWCGEFAKRANTVEEDDKSGDWAPTTMEDLLRDFGRLGLFLRDQVGECVACGSTDQLVITNDDGDLVCVNGDACIERFTEQAQGRARG